MENTTFLWEDSVPFKQALAVVSLVKRKHDAELKATQERCVQLEEKINDLESKLNNLYVENSTEALLESCFSPSSNNSQISSPVDVQAHIEALSISISLWRQVFEHLSMSWHKFLGNAFLYVMKTHQESSMPLSMHSPIESLILLIDDILKSENIVENDEMHAKILEKATLCLADVFCYAGNNIQLVQESDFVALRGLIDTVFVMHAKNSSKIDMIRAGEIKEGMEERVDTDVSRQNVSLQHSTAMMTHLMQSPGTGYVLLSYTVNAVKECLEQLQMHVLYHDNEIDDVTGTQYQLCATECLTCIGRLQDALRKLPEWTVDIPPHDEYLRQTSTEIWNLGTIAEVIAPIYPLVSNNVSRCSSLLVHALQQISNTTSSNNNNHP